MALRFFRKNQKLVFGIMVLLMIVFALSTSLPSLLEHSRGGGTVGRAMGKKITSDLYVRAEADMRILRNWLGLGRARTATRQGEWVFRQFLMSNPGHETEQDHAWMLLVFEAEQMGFKTTEQDVDAFMAAAGLTGDDYARVVADISTDRLTEKHLRRAIADYLLVLHSYRASLVTTPPSVPELKYAYRDLSERIELDTVAFGAEKYLADEADPDPAAVRKQFDDYRHLFPRHPENRTEFGFGYRQPDRVKISWLAVDQDLVARATTPTEAQMRSYWQAHKGELTKRVQVPPRDPAATQPAEPEYQDVVIEVYSEAKAQIRRRLQEQFAEGKAAELLDRARRLIDAKAASPDPYAAAAEAMTSAPQRRAEAQALLTRTVGPLPVATGTLEYMLEQLMELSGVGIVFPLGEGETLKLPPDLTVSLKGTDDKATIGDILNRIAAELKYPPVTWTTCDALPMALFPTEPIRLTPVSAGVSGMMDAQQLRTHAVLGNAYSARRGGMALTAVVGRSKQLLGPDSTDAPLIEKGGDFRQAMYLGEPFNGRLIWRLVDVAAAHDPEEMTAEIREQIVADLKVIEAFKRATAAAEGMLGKLHAGGKLADLAKAVGLEVTPLGPFARKELNYFFGGISVTNVPGVGPNEEFIKAAFELAPADPEPPYQGAPSKVVPLARQRQALLIQRTGYTPIVASEFQQRAGDLAGMLVQTRQMEHMELSPTGMVNTWLRFENIVDRLGVEWEKARRRAQPDQEPPRPEDEGV